MQTKERRRFLELQIFNMTLAATVQRSNMYKPGLSERDRKPLQASLYAALASLRGSYETEVSEQKHIRNITWLATTITAKHAKLLAGKRMKFGHAQKALNLYLKYWWCLGELPTPPHCPLDSVILRKIPGFTQERWTKLTSAERYKLIIAAFKKQAEQSRPKLSLAVWELKAYNSGNA